MTDWGATTMMCVFYICMAAVIITAIWRGTL